MMCFKRIQLIYILMPLFLMAISSCEKKTEDEIPPVVQEVITMKIKPMEEHPAQVESGVPKASLNNGSDSSAVSERPLQDQETSGIEVASGEQAISLPATGGNRASKELTFSIEKTPVKDAVAKIDPPASPSQTAQTKNDTGAIRENPARIEDLTTTNSAMENAGSISKVASAIEPATSPESSTGTAENKALLPAGEISGEISEESLFYIPKGKTDPFEPLLKEKVPVVETEEKTEDYIPERILTPLEKLDFSQMKLVAILTKESGNSVAMIQESTGKGYIVNIGTYMGLNSGQVVSIEKDKLVIHEKVKDYKGNFIDHFQELKLNKLDDKG